VGSRCRKRLRSFPGAKIKSGLLCAPDKLAWPSIAIHSDIMTVDSLFTSGKLKRPGVFSTGIRFVVLPFVLLSWVFCVAIEAGAEDAGASVSKKPASGQFEGSFDKLEVVSLGGWAWDALQANTPIKVEVYDATTLLATIVAGEFREDLKSAGKGDGKHAFNYALPQTLRDGQSHIISVRYAGTSSDLPGSPKTLSFPKP
jgi:hypothetical protein